MDHVRQTRRDVARLLGRRPTGNDMLVGLVGGFTTSVVTACLQTFVFGQSIATMLFGPHQFTWLGTEELPREGSCDLIVFIVVALLAALAAYGWRQIARRRQFNRQLRDFHLIR